MVVGEGVEGPIVEGVGVERATWLENGVARIIVVGGTGAATCGVAGFVVERASVFEACM